MSTSTSRRYVWDDNEEDDHREMLKSSKSPRSHDNVVDHEMQYSRISSKTKELDEYIDQMSISMPEPSLSRDNNNKHTNISASISKTIDVLQTKIDAMKQELSRKVEDSLSLHEDLKRLKTAKEKRYMKYHDEWQYRLDAARDDGEVALSKQQQMKDKLNKDVNSLQTKLHDLEGKLDSFHHHRDDYLQRAQDEVSIKRRRMRRQWEVEEKTSRDKVIKSKENALKKQAADVYAPMVDELVMLNKETVMRRRQDVDSALDALRLDLQADIDRRYGERMKHMRDDGKEEEARQKLLYEKQLAEMERYHDMMTMQLKEKATSAIIQLAEQMEKRLQTETESVTSTVQAAEQVEADQMLEIVTKHQREVRQLTQRHDEALSQLRKSIDKEKSEYESQRREAKKLHQLSTQQRQQDMKKRAMEAETNRLLQKVRDELLRERDDIRDKIDQQTSDYRASCQAKIEALQLSVRNASQHLSSCEDDKIQAETRLSSLRSTAQAKKNNIDALSKTIDNLKREKESIESQLSLHINDPATANNDRILRQQQNEDELKTWRQRRDLARLELQSFMRSIAEKEESKGKELATQLGRIRDKIDRLVASKAKTRDDFQQQLSDLKSARARLEGELEHIREAHVELDHTRPIEAEGDKRIGNRNGSNKLLSSSKGRRSSPSKRSSTDRTRK